MTRFWNASGFLRQSLLVAVSQGEMPGRPDTGARSFSWPIAYGAGPRHRFAQERLVAIIPATVLIEVIWPFWSARADLTGRCQTAAAVRALRTIGREGGTGQSRNRARSPGFATASIFSAYDDHQPPLPASHRSDRPPLQLLAPAACCDRPVERREHPHGGAQPRPAPRWIRNTHA